MCIGRFSMKLFERYQRSVAALAHLPGPVFVPTGYLNSDVPDRPLSGRVSDAGRVIDRAEMMGVDGPYRAAGSTLRARWWCASSCGDRMCCASSASWPRVWWAWRRAPPPSLLREVSRFGHDVKLMPPAFVKA